MASRDEALIPAARLRAERRILEIGVGDLAMSGHEARALLEGAGVRVSHERTAELVHRTEGWPVGLYLAALAVKAGTPAAGFTFTGDDRLMGDYLRSELLGRVTATQAELPPSDVSPRPVVGTALRRRGRRHRLRGRTQADGEPQPPHRAARPPPRVVPVPPLAAGAACKPSSRSGHPDEVPVLHSRAAAWYQANGMPEAAIEHAQAAGEADQVATLVLELMQGVWASGRADTVQRWMEWLRDRPSAAALCRHRRSRRTDLCPDRANERGGALGRGRRTPSRHGNVARRQHRRGNVGIPAEQSCAATARRPCAAMPAPLGKG